MVEYVEWDHRIKRSLSINGDNVPLRVCRRIRLALQAEGHDSRSSQALPWDEAADKCDAANDGRTWDEEPFLQALGVGSSSYGEHWMEAVEEGKLIDDFVSKDNDILTPRTGDWEVKPRIKQRPVKTFYGLDTETYQGWARLMCLQPLSDGPAYELWMDPDKKAAPAILDVLSASTLRGACVLSYNMRFDAESILKHFLPHVGVEGLQHLCDYQVLESTIGDKDWRIMYIPTKVLRISRLKGWGQDRSRGRKSDAFSLYDMAQFFPGYRLQDAAQKYLGMEKLGDVDAARLNVDLEYWSGRESAIAKYCRQDAKLTALLGKFMSDKVWELWEVDFQAPYSPAQSAQKIFLSRSGIMHPIKRQDILQACYNAYYGGRIECRTRGHLENCSLVDIKSAYIWGMKDLPDTKGEWFYSSGESSNLDNPSVPYAFVHATVETECGEDDWGPLPVRRKDGLLVYPDGRLTGWWPWPEVRWWIDKGFIKRWTIHRSVWLQPDEDNCQDPFRYLESIYRQKEEEKDDARKFVIKTCGLGMYGKTAQAVEKLVAAGDDTPETFVGMAPMRLALEPGYLFNPAVASYVTMRVRCKLMDKALSLGTKSATVLTDSVIVEGAVSSDASKELGGWDTKPKERGDCRVLMAGMYQFKGQAPKVRGLPMKTGGRMKDDAWDYWNLTGESVRVEKPGPLHLHGALRREQPELVNVWVPRVKKLTPNADSKRTWRKWRTFEDFFSAAWTGKVLRVNMQSAKVVARSLGLKARSVRL